MHLFIHGVPDTPAMWGGLLDALALPDDTWRAPALPGFDGSIPDDFTPTRHGYTDWLVEQVDALHAHHGPIHLVGHDWGALLTMRVACLRPSKLASWTVMNAGFDPDYRGHFFARLWNIKGLGELAMALNPPAVARVLLRWYGMPPALAAHEAPRGDVIMKRSILELYRSADGLRDFVDWHPDVEHIAPRGLLLWGDRDPFMPVAVGERIAATTGMPLHVEPGSGHWLPASHPEAVAARLEAHWAGARRPSPGD